MLAFFAIDSFLRHVEKIKLLGEHDAERLMEALDRDRQRQKDALARRLKLKQSRAETRRGNIEEARKLEAEVEEEEARAQRRAEARAHGRFFKSGSVHVLHIPELLCVCCILRTFLC